MYSVPQEGITTRDSHLMVREPEFRLWDRVYHDLICVFQRQPGYLLSRNSFNSSLQRRS